MAFLLFPRVKFVFRSDMCDDSIGSLWIELLTFSIYKEVCFVFCVYRPPSQHNLFDIFGGIGNSFLLLFSTCYVYLVI